MAILNRFSPILFYCDSIHFRKQQKTRKSRVQEVIRVRSLLPSGVGKLPKHLFYYALVQSQRGGWSVTDLCWLLEPLISGSFVVSWSSFWFSLRNFCGSRPAILGLVGFAIRDSVPLRSGRIPSSIWICKQTSRKVADRSSSLERSNMLTTAFERRFSKAKRTVVSQWFLSQKTDCCCSVSCHFPFGFRASSSSFLLREC